MVQLELTFMKKGFTLAELLIALVILGVIATFTIPKVLQSQQDAKYKAMAKEAASMISGAYDAYRQSATPTAGMTSSNLTSYMNYVRANTAFYFIDNGPTLSFLGCSAAGAVCLHLHNGGILMADGVSFNNTASTNAIEFIFDPDAVYGGSTSGPSKSVIFYLYYNGRLTTRGVVSNPSCNSIGCWTPDSTLDPTWFNWN